MPHFKQSANVVFNRHLVAVACLSWTYLFQQLLEDDEEGHEIARVVGEQALSTFAAHVFCSGAHRGRNNFACGVHEQFCEPFEDLLDDLRVGLLEIGDSEVDTDIRYTPGDFGVGLRMLVLVFVMVCSPYQCHESIVLWWWGCSWVVSSVRGGARSHAHARTVRHDGLRMRLRCSGGCDGTVLGSVLLWCGDVHVPGSHVVSTKRWRGTNERPYSIRQARFGHRFRAEHCAAHHAIRPMTLNKGIELAERTREQFGSSWQHRSELSATSGCFRQNFFPGYASDRSS